MANVSVSHMILFIASVIVAASVAGVLTQEVSRLSAAIDDEGIDIANEIRTDIEIISDAGSDSVYSESTNNVTLLIKNTGSKTIPTDTGGIDVVIEGEYRANLSISVLDDSSWGTNDVVRLNVSEVDLSNGDHRAKVTVNGDEEVFEFRT